MVARTAVRLYATLCISSLFVALLWQSISPPMQKPESIPMYAYRHLIGQLDGRSCPSYPVCSIYATKAIRAHGLLLGSWLSIDRLIHEHDDIYRDQALSIHGENRLYDPLSRNDFWIK